MGHKRGDTLLLLLGRVRISLQACHAASGSEAPRGRKCYGDMLECNAVVKGHDFSSPHLQGGTARILRSEIGSEASELFRLR